MSSSSAAAAAASTPAAADSSARPNCAVALATLRGILERQEQWEERYKKEFKGDDRDHVWNLFMHMVSRSSKATA
jgi:hypothetical protein